MEFLYRNKLLRSWLQGFSQEQQYAVLALQCCPDVICLHLLQATSREAGMPSGRAGLHRMLHCPFAPFRRCQSRLSGFDFELSLPERSQCNCMLTKPRSVQTLQHVTKNAAGLRIADIEQIVLSNAATTG
jgi:hypothetical protein